MDGGEGGEGKGEGIVGDTEGRIARRCPQRVQHSSSSNMVWRARGMHESILRGW